jgi:hypothetical protein
MYRTQFIKRKRKTEISADLWEEMWVETEKPEIT